MGGCEPQAGEPLGGCQPQAGEPLGGCQPQPGDDLARTGYLLGKPDLWRDWLIHTFVYVTCILSITQMDGEPQMIVMIATKFLLRLYSNDPGVTCEMLPDDSDAALS